MCFTFCPIHAIVDRNVALWIVFVIVGQDLAFMVSNKTVFELPLSNVANSNIAGRTEVSLEFMTSNKKPTKGSPDELCEIRFFVPGTQAKGKGSDAGSQHSGDEGEEISAAQAFHEAVKEKAEIGQVAGDVVLSFEEVLVLTPRGRYDLDMFPEFLRLRGKTYDYKIMFASISRLFLLPKDDQHVLFIVSPWSLIEDRTHSRVTVASLDSATPFDKVRHGISTLSCNSAEKKRSPLNLICRSMCLIRLFHPN